MARHPSIIIHPPENCPEDWEQMTPTGCGRFCASCQKTVIDFTVMSDNEIINIFETQKNICGQINDNQLNRELVYTPEPKKIVRSVYGKIAAFLLIANAFAQHSVAQQGKSVKTTLSPTNAKKKIPVKKLEGRIIELNGKGIKSEMQIVVSCDSGKYMLTQMPDSNGKFQIDLDKRFWDKTISLSVHLTGTNADKAQHAIMDNVSTTKFVSADIEFPIQWNPIIIYEQVLDKVEVTSFVGRRHGGVLPCTSTATPLPRHHPAKIWSWITAPFKKIF